MLIKVGYEIAFSCPEPMAMVLTEFASQPVLFRAFDYDIELDADWDVLDRFSPGHD